MVVRFPFLIFHSRAPFSYTHPISRQICQIPLPITIFLYLIFFLRIIITILYKGKVQSNATLVCEMGYNINNCKRDNDIVSN